jgi:voltage-gated potassium channel
MKRQGVYSGLYDRLRTGFTLGVVCYFAAVILYYGMGCLVGMNAGYGRSVGDTDDDVWPLRHCFYAAGITFTTVGYADELGTDDVRIYRHPATGKFYAYNSHDLLVPEPGAPPATVASLELVRDFSIFTTLLTVTLAFVGMGVFVYVIGAITAFFVEGGYVELRRQLKLEKEVARLQDHIVLCGAGPLALHAIERFVAERVRVLVVESDDALLRHLREEFPGVLHVRGDPTDIETLHEAGLARARGVVTTLPEDLDNLVVVVTAHQENPRLRILSSAGSREVAVRLRRAGAHETVIPSFLGGMRIASEAIRPTVVRFLDGALGHEEEHHGYRFLGIRAEEASPAAGKSLAASRFTEETGLAVLAIRAPGQAGFTYNPGPDAILSPGTVVGVLASDEEEPRARAFLAGTPAEGGA